MLNTTAVNPRDNPDPTAPSSRQAALCFTTTTTVAGLTALAAALALGLAHPFWAPMSVWLVVQRNRALLLERAGARVFGSALGSLVGLGLMKASSGHSAALLCLMLCWISLCTAGARLFRFYHSYSILLAGYTAAVVILAGFSYPVHREALSAMRVESTLIGVTAALLLTGLCIRGNVKTKLREQVDTFMAQANEMAVSERTGQVSDARFAALLINAGKVEAMIDERFAGSVPWSGHGRAARSLLSDAIGKVADARAQRSCAMRDYGHFAPLMPSEPTRVRQVRDGARLRAVLLARLDVKAALRAACRSVLCLGGLIVIWQATGWQHGGAMVTTAAIFTALFSTHNDPVAATRTALMGSLLGVLAALAYRSIDLLHGATISSVLLGIAPFLVVGAYAMAMPRFNKLAIDYLMTFLLVVQPMVHAPAIEMGTSLQQAAAILAGVTAVILAFQFVIPANPAQLMQSLDSSVTNASRAAQMAPTEAQARHHRLSAILRAIKMGDVARSFGLPIPPDVLDRISRATLNTHASKAWTSP